MKMAKRSSEEFQEVSVVSCKYLSDSFSFALLSYDAMSLCFRLRSLARSRFDCFCSISALGRSFSHVDRLLLPPVPCGPCSVSALACARSFDRLLVGPVPLWLVDHRNRAHTIKVRRIYIYTYLHTNAS